MKGLSIIVPSHNSSKAIEDSVKRYYAEFHEKFRNFEIIVVCNDCWDNTAEICKNLAKTLPVEVIEIPQRGKGYALITGFNKARFDYIGFLDADNPFNLNEVHKMISRLDKYDVVIASKYLRGMAKQQDSLQRRVLSLGGSFVSKVLFGLNFRDTQAGAKFLRKQAWEKIRGKFTCTGFDFDIEFLYKVTKNKFKILEVYIPFKKENFSTVRLKYLPGIVKRLLKLRFLR